MVFDVWIGDLHKRDACLSKIAFLACVAFEDSHWNVTTAFKKSIYADQLIDIYSIANL